MDNLSSWIWVLIPLAAIAAGAFREWVKFRATQRDLGSSTDALEQAVRAIKADLEGQQAGLETRIANLEAIVTSQTWDFMNESRSLGSAGEALPDLTNDLETLKRELSDTRKAELLARRIK